MSNPHEGHRERLKRRFLLEGLDHFEPHNALELLLFYAVGRCDTNGLAHELLDRFGSIAGVMDAPISELMKVKGIGENSAILLKLVPALLRQYQQDKVAPSSLLNTTEVIGSYVSARFLGRTEEAVLLVCLDNRGKVLSSNFISTGGTVNASSVTLRTIVEEAVRCGATGIVLGHNHPKGFAIPSAQDLAVTRAIAEQLRAIGVALVDHIIVSRDDFVSMADSGALA